MTPAEEWARHVEGQRRWQIRNAVIGGLPAKKIEELPGITEEERAFAREWENRLMEKCGQRIDAEHRCVLEKNHQREGAFCSTTWIAREVRDAIVEDMWRLGERIFVGRRGFIGLGGPR